MLISIASLSMRPDKNNAFKLRLGGQSYSEINKTLGVPKSTLSGWFSGLVLSKKLRDRIDSRAYKKSIAGLLKRNKNQTTLAVKRSFETRKRAADKAGILSKRDLFVMGVALYWAEGYKRPVIRNGREVTHHVVSLTNSDPYLVRTFLRFLREYCEIPEGKIKASLRIFTHQNEKELLDFWGEETGMLPQNFRKTYYGISKSSMGKRPFNRLPHGVIQVVVADTVLFHTIMGYIEGFKRLV